MAAKLTVSVVALSALGLAACTNPDGSTNNTGTGALVGAGVGAVAGVQGQQHIGGTAVVFIGDADAHAERTQHLGPAPRRDAVAPVGAAWRRGDQQDIQRFRHVLKPAHTSRRCGS